MGQWPDWGDDNVIKAVTAFVSFAVALAGWVAVAHAGQPTDWEMWFQPAASEFASRTHWFGAYTMWFITPITLFVMALLAIVMIRYNRKANPVPSKTSHNSLIEVVWTVAPIVILIFIALPSFALLRFQMVPPEEPQITIKTTGYQWYWGYEYQDDSGLSFDSLMIREDADREALGKQDKSVYPRLLAVDNEMVVPVNVPVRVLITAADVIHSFTVPALGFKMDAIPGRMNETWFKADREGLYYGQCSELCGRDHAFMPIAVRVVSAEQYEAWKAAAVDDLEGANRALMAEIESQTRVAAK